MPEATLAEKKSGGSMDGGSSTWEGMSWEELGRLAKSMENTIDGKLLTLGRLTSAALRAHRYEGVHRGTRESPLESAERLAGEVGEELRVLALLIETLCSRMETSAGPVGSLHQLQRHRDIFSEYSKEFRKTREHLRNAKEHAELLGSVRDELAVYSTGRSARGASDAHSYLLGEVDRIQGAQTQTDHIINVAYAAQSGIAQNRITLLDSGRKIQGIASYLPTVQGVMSKIRLRRNRDTLIIAVLIGFLLAVTVIYIARGSQGK